MATLDRMAELGPLLDGRLASGEMLLGAFRVNLTTGSDDAASAARTAAITDAVHKLAPPASTPPSGAARIGEAVLDFATGGSPLRAQFPDLPNPAGVALSGGPGSQAAWLRDQFGEAPRHVLAVTSARAILLRDDHGGPERYRALQAGGPPLPYVAVAAVARTQLRDVRHAPKLLLRGRVELQFVDGSVLALSALKSSLARELVAALTG